MHSLIKEESLSSACVNSIEFAETKFNLFVPLRDCNNAEPMQKLEASHIA